MKKLSAYLFLILFSFSASSFADDISDFQIEGINIGDSLLDHLSKEEIITEIERTKPDYNYLREEFGEVYIFDKLKTYDLMSFFVKLTDSKYIIYGVFGTIPYNKNINQCYKKQKELEKEFSVDYKDTKKQEGEQLHPIDPSGKSTVRYTYLIFKSGDLIRIECTNFEENLKKKNNWNNGLTVSLVKARLQNWLSSY